MQKGELDAAESTRAFHELVCGGCWVKTLQRATQTCRSSTFTTVQQPVQSGPWPGVKQHLGSYHAGYDIQREKGTFKYQLAVKLNYRWQGRRMRRPLETYPAVPSSSFKAALKTKPEPANFSYILELKISSAKGKSSFFQKHKSQSLVVTSQETPCNETSGIQARMLGCILQRQAPVIKLLNTYSGIKMIFQKY